MTDITVFFVSGLEQVLAFYCWRIALPEPSLHVWS